MTPNRPDDRLVYILSGLSGAGKTHTAERKVALNAQHGVKTTRLSTNDWFTRPDGSWVFDEQLLNRHHELCFEEFNTALAADDPVVIVDNTNILHRHRRQYEDAAWAARYHYINVVVGSFDQDFAEFCASRTLHDVKIDYISAMAERYDPPRNKEAVYIPKTDCGWSKDWRTQPQRFHKGCCREDCSSSTSVMGVLTFGTGELDDNGYWQHPCRQCEWAWHRQYVTLDTESDEFRKLVKDDQRKHAQNG